MHLHAQRVWVSQAKDGAVISWSESSDERDRYVTVAHTTGGPDRSAAGKAWLEIDEPGRDAQDAAVGYELDGPRLTIHVAPEHRSLLGVEGDISIDIDRVETSRSQIMKALAFMFDCEHTTR